MKARCACFVGIAALGACGTPPAATPPPGELPTLRARADRSRSDTEAVLRLSSGLWRTGERTEARDLLEGARAEMPEALEYTAALAVMAEGEGDYMGARTEYLRFLQTAGLTRLARSFAERTHHLRGLTADPLAQELVEGGRTLDHGRDPSFVLALPRIQAPPGDDDLARFAIMATELLLRDLRARRFTVLDWELSEAVRNRVASGLPVPSVTQRMAEHLSARVVVTGAVQSAGQDSVSIDLAVLRMDDLGTGLVATDTLTLGLAPYAPDRSRLATRVIEMASGAEEGVLAPAELEIADFTSRAALDRLGAALLRITAGDGPGAREELVEGARLAPEFGPIQERLDQVDALAAIERSATLPFAEDILAFSRSAERTRRVVGSADRAWRTAGPLERGGVGEVLGLDRVGAQVFLDLVIRIGGPS